MTAPLSLVERLRNGGQTDLADMAQELVDALARVIKHRNFFPCECGALQCATTQARAAIAKATGEAA